MRSAGGGVLVVQPYEGTDRGQLGVLQFVHEGRGEVRGGGRLAAEDRAEGLAPGAAAVRRALAGGARSGRRAEWHQAAQQHGRLGHAVCAADAEQRFDAGPGLRPRLAFAVVDVDGTAQSVAFQTAAGGAVRVEIVQRDGAGAGQYGGQGQRGQPSRVGGARGVIGVYVHDEGLLRAVA